MLANVVEKPKDEVGKYEEVFGNENDVLENAEGKLVDGVEVGADGNNILGWNVCLGINGFVEWSVVELRDEVVVNKDEPTDSKRLVANWEVEGLCVYADKAASSTEYWKRASSISLSIVAFIASRLS